LLHKAMSYGTSALLGFVRLMGENGLPLEVKDTERLAATIGRPLDAPELRCHISAGGVATMRRLLGERRRIHAEQVVERLVR
jgi:hypothetical protein